MTDSVSLSIRAKVWLLALGVVALVGLGSWAYEIQTGLVVTGMRNVFSWGLYIMAFVLFVGLSAGGLIISSTPKYFHSEKFDAIARIGVLLSLSCITVAGLLILPDIGRVDRIYQFFTTPDFRSPLVWDFTIVLAYGILSLWYTWLLTRRDLAARSSWLAFGVEDSAQGRSHDKRLAFWTAVVALPAAVLLHSITGWIFATQIGRAEWFSPLVAPVFIAKALVSGLGLLLAVSIIADRLTEFTLPREYLPSLGKILGVFIAVHVVYLLVAERMPHVWAQNDTMAGIFGSLVFGDSIFFWAWTIIGGVLPLVLLASPTLRQRVWAVFTASILAILGVLFEGIRLVFIGYDQINISAAPGVSVGQYGGMGSHIWAQAGIYTPTLVEIAITVGLVAIGALVFSLGFIYLPLQPDRVIADGGEGDRQ